LFFWSRRVQVRHPLLGTKTSDEYLFESLDQVRGITDLTRRQAFKPQLLGL